MTEGLSTKRIRALVSDGVIERIARGLFRLAGTQTPMQDIAAVLLRHHEAVASHASALFVHGLDVEPPADPLRELQRQLRRSRPAAS